MKIGPSALLLVAAISGRGMVLAEEPITPAEMSETPSGSPTGMEQRSGDSIGLKNGTEQRCEGVVGLKKKAQTGCFGLFFRLPNNELYRFAVGVV